MIDTGSEIANALVNEEPPNGKHQEVARIELDEQQRQLISSIGVGAKVVDIQHGENGAVVYLAALKDNEH